MYTTYRFNPIAQSNLPKTSVKHWIISLFTLTLFKVIWRRFHPIHSIWYHTHYRNTIPYSFSYESTSRFNRDTNTWKPTIRNKTVYYHLQRMTKRKAKKLNDKAMITANYIMLGTKPDMDFITANYLKRVWE